MPPSSDSSPVAVRRSTIAASRNIDIESSPWLTIWSTDAVEAEVVDREDAERDQPHLRERRVRDDAADVGSPEGEERAVNEPNGRERQDQVAKVLPLGRGT